jgi:hypothetical protein
MADSDKNVSYGVTADASGFEDGMARAAEAAKAASAQISGGMAQVQSVLAKVQGGVIALTALLAGGKMFGDATRDAAAYDLEVAKLAKTMGMTLGEASRVDVALKGIGKTSDDLTSASMKLLRQVNSNEQGLNNLGLKTRDGNGHLLSMMDLMKNGLDTLRSYKEGADRDAIALTLFGKAASEVLGLQKLTNEELERGAAMAEKYGLIVDGKTTAAAKKFKESQEELKIASEALRVEIGNALIPTLNTLAHIALVDIPQAFREAKKSFDDWADDVVNRAEPIRQSLHSMVAGVEEILDKIRPQWLKDMKRDQAAQQNEYFRSLYGGAADAARESKRFDERANDMRGSGTDGGKRAPRAPGAVATAQSRVGRWEAQLAEAKLAFQEQNNAAGTFYQYSKQQELAYWNDKLALTTKRSAENIAVRRKSAELGLAINTDAFNREVGALQAQEAAYKQNLAARLALLNQEADLVAQHFKRESKEYEEVQKRITATKREAVEQQRKIDDLRVDAVRNAQLAEIDIEREHAQLQRDLHLITDAALLQQETQFENRRFQIQLQALKDREALLLSPENRDSDPVQLAALHAQIEQLEQQHQARLLQIDGAATRERSKYVTGMYESMQSGFASVLSKTLQGTATLSETFRGLFQAVVQAVANALAQIAADWLMVQIKNMIMGKAMAVSRVSESAAEAGAAGTASWAGAPWPINMGAPAFGAAMAATALSFAPLASAEGGFDIPGSINPLVQTHANEMVLPAKHADVIRRLADQGDAQRQSAPPTEPSINVTKLHGDFFMIHRAELARAMMSARRDFLL